MALPGSLREPALRPQSRFASLGRWCGPGTTGRTCAAALTLARPMGAHPDRSRGPSCPALPHGLQGCDKSLCEPWATKESAARAEPEGRGGGTAVPLSFERDTKAQGRID